MDKSAIPGMGTVNQAADGMALAGREAGAIPVLRQEEPEGGPNKLTGNPVWASGADRPSDMTVLGGSVLFQASTAAAGRELWKYDASTKKAELVKDVYPGPLSGLTLDSPQQFTVSGSYLYFTTTYGFGPDLWRSDGTAEGTILLRARAKVVRPASVPQSYLKPFQGNLLYPAEDGVWRTDGTVEGTFRLSEGGDQITVFNQNAFFAGPGIGNYPFLYRTDGTVSGTGPVVSAGLNLRSSLMMEANGSLFFAGEDIAAGIELWKTDGTAAGTKLVRDLTPGTKSSTLSSWAVAGNRFYFVKHSTLDTVELWSTDGSGAGTLKMTNLRLNDGWPAVSNLMAVGNLLFFTTNVKVTGCELWRSNGTAAGTVRLKDFFKTGAWGPQPSVITAVGGKLLFSAETAANGLELWVSDGTAGGTKLLSDILPGTASSDPLFLGQEGDIAFFAATDQPHGREIWITDGTTAGTRMLEDVVPGLASSMPFWVGNAGGRLLAMVEKDPASLNRVGFREISVAPVNQPPVLTEAPASVPPVIGGIDSAGIPFSATDSDSAPDTLQWSAVSDNPGLLPADAIRITGTGNTRWIILAPAPSAPSGTVNVTLTLTDGTTTVTRQFPVRIMANHTEFSRAADGQVRLIFTGIPGRTYVVQRSVDLKNWNDVQTVIPGGTGEISWTDTTAPPSKAYYRLSGPR